mgnify:FL=1
MKNSAPGFTLIETLIAITLITVVISAVTGLILSTLLANQRILHSLQGMYLAQESLEAVRFMRDSNWLQNYSWNGGSLLWGSDFDMGTESQLNLFLTDEACPPCFGLARSAEDSIVTDDSGFEYTRALSFKPVTDLQDVVEVTATVSWEERGIARSVELSTYLSDWK